MVAVARLQIGEQPVPTVPPKSLREDAATFRLFVVKDHRIEERIVKPGEHTDDAVAILTGVAPGEQVVVDPGQDVHDGARVQ
jgi:multidrug efflux pump subunit AcrA (membrane-fusion protein)